MQGVVPERRVSSQPAVQSSQITRANGSVWREEKENIRAGHSAGWLGDGGKVPFPKTAGEIEWVSKGQVRWPNTLSMSPVRDFLRVVIFEELHRPGSIMVVSPRRRRAGVGIFCHSDQFALRRLDLRDFRSQIRVPRSKGPHRSMPGKWPTVIGTCKDITHSRTTFCVKGTTLISECFSMIA